MTGSSQLFDRERLFAELSDRGLSAWAEELQRVCHARLSEEAHGNMSHWMSAWRQLPSADGSNFDATGDAVRVEGTASCCSDELKQTLMQFHPWRKGPFELFEVLIDTEWQSNLKWNRLAGHIDFRDQAVLDVGCGNGYYGWKMIEAGAELVLGCDPFPLYLMQFEVLRRYTPRPERNFVVPLADHELPAALHAFDTTCSMGVLYHRTSPIDHLQTLWQTLKPGGQLVLETLIVESQTDDVLMPESRYAKMRNVWFIPSLSMLELWLRRTGFSHIKVVDVSPTTTTEQRQTPWMTFESLEDFLDPNDSRKTVEGYPSPIRALITAQRS